MVSVSAGKTAKQRTKKLYCPHGAEPHTQVFNERILVKGMQVLPWDFTRNGAIKVNMTQDMWIFIHSSPKVGHNLMAMGKCGSQSESNWHI